MSRPEHLVIVGSGMAAVRLVEELVRRGAAGTQRITLLGDEPHPPYNRILLSAVLEGTHRPEALTLRDREWYAEHGVDLRTGSRVLEVDRERGDVMLVDGTTIPYDALVLATGAIPALPPIRGLVRMDGSLHPAVHAFRSLDDCRRLLEAVSLRDASSLGFSGQATGPTGGTGRRAVVVGGGLLGLQVARALSVRGLATEIVEGGDHLLRSQVATAAGRLIARDLERLGTGVYTGTRAIRLTDRDPAAPDAADHHAQALQLDTGVHLGTDMVVLTAGGRPSTALARRADLEVRRGIVVDDRLRTSDERIFAIGDCAQHGGRVTGFVPPAWEQAGVLAAVLSGATGEQATYDGSRIVARLRATDLDVAVLGDPEREAGQVVAMSNPFARSHRKLVIRDGRIVGGTLVGDLGRIGLITQHYDRQTVLGETEPRDLLLAERSARPTQLPDDAEVCHCAGVTAGAIRACTSFEQARERTRATTGCGGCAAGVRQLLTSAPGPTPAAPAAQEGTPR